MERDEILFMKLGFGLNGELPQAGKGKKTVRPAMKGKEEETSFLGFMEGIVVEFIRFRML